VVALIGFNRPRRALSRTFKSSSLELLKGATFVGLAAFVVFGFSPIGEEMNFFFALLPAVGVWIGVLAGLEQLRRKGPANDKSAAAAVQVDPVWRQRQQRQQERTSEPGRLFSDDPWGVIAAQRKAAHPFPRRREDMFNRAETEPDPLIEPHVGAGRHDDGLVAYASSGSKEDESRMDNTSADHGEPVARDATETEDIPEARADIVSLLRQHVDEMRHDEPEHQQPATEEEQPADDEPDEDETAAAEDTPAEEEEPKDQEPAAGQPDPDSESWLQENEPIKELDPKITRHKDELEARPMDSKSGRYKYKPKLVKSLFSSDDD
jgi:hypothetical protein